MIMSNSNSSSDVFCQLPGYSMQSYWMVAIGPDVHCTYWVGLIECSNAFLYTLSCILNIFMPISIEWLAHMRGRFAKSYLTKNNEAPLWLQYVPTLLYMLRMVLAYFCMLVVMQYEIIQFVSLIVGLGIGNGIFSVYLPLREKAADKQSERNKLVPRGKRRASKQPLCDGGCCKCRPPPRAIVTSSSTVNSSDQEPLLQGSAAFSVREAPPRRKNDFVLRGRDNTGKQQDKERQEDNSNVNKEQRPNLDDEDSGEELQEDEEAEEEQNEFHSGSPCCGGSGAH